MGEQGYEGCNRGRKFFALNAALDADRDFLAALGQHDIAARPVEL